MVFATSNSKPHAPGGRSIFVIILYEAADNESKPAIKPDGRLVVGSYHQPPGAYVTAPEASTALPQHQIADAVPAISRGDGDGNEFSLTRFGGIDDVAG